MGKWSKSLPEPMENHVDRAANALYFIGMSMMDEFPVRNRVANARRAAAEVRAWRKSLGVKSKRETRDADGNPREALREALRRIVWADESITDGTIVDLESGATYLRVAEAYLRIAARLLDKERA